MTELLANHLWQSTLFAAAAGLLTLAFRKNRAHVRYWLWLAASVKFLIPFAVLMAIGAQIEGPTLVTAQRELGVVVASVSEPFSLAELNAVASSSPRGAEGAPLRSMVTTGLVAIWVIGCLTLLFVWAVRWQRVARAVRAASPIEAGPVTAALGRLHNVEAGLPPGQTRPCSLRIVSSATTIEPGVFGIVRPALLWPRSISERLSEEQIEAILAHELAHVRRRDNLAAAVHMLVEAVFWFHPLVWWLGARLVDERERACDEEVVRLGSEPHVYAESILKTCQFYIESPLVCMAGVTGSNLKKRIELIMRNDSNVALSAPKRILLGASLVAAIALPVTVGILTSPRLSAQIVAPAADAPTFEVASIKPSASGGRMGGRGTPGRFTTQGMPVRRLIRQAYDIHDSQIIGGPDWAGSQGYDIDATTGGKPPDQMRFMMQSLLRDRFKLTFHKEQRELATYALVVARSDGRLGPGLKRIPDDECPAPGSPRRGGPPNGPAAGPPPSPFDPNAKAPCGSIIFGPGRLLAHGVPIDMLTRSLGNLPAITSFNRLVTNMTKLEGVYDFDFRWTNEFGPGGPPPSGGPAAVNPGDEPVLFTALQEQLELKLTPQKATLDVLVIDSVDRPGEN
ncbi:MAG TPA: M56 family metallopeptidase [Vicinamibacterales bacterium]|nr:M56 family metallopeptidase [Vicinamibacterales bacterium]